MMATFDRLVVGGSVMSVRVAEPDGAGPHPGIVVTHHRGALDAFTCRFSDDLAAAGYVAAAPSFYHRRPDGEATQASMAALDDAEMIADMNATARYLGGRADVRADALGIVGHCMGGRAAFLGASTDGVYRACGIFYGGNIFKPWGAGNPAPFARIADISCPVIGFFGNDDDNPSPADVAALSAGFAGHAIRHSFHRYDGAGHAFQNFLGDNFREAQAKDAQVKLLVFLSSALGPGAG